MYVISIMENCSVVVLLLLFSRLSTFFVMLTPILFATFTDISNYFLSLIENRDIPLVSIICSLQCTICALIDWLCSKQYACFWGVKVI